MKSVISTTYDNQYLYFLPIVTFCWNRLGVDVICFMPDVSSRSQNDANKYFLTQDTILKFGGKESTYWFKSPKHKEATYAQCSRLYGACLDLPEDEILIISDCDMANFKIPTEHHVGDRLTVLGFDLVPDGQVPMCYVSGTVKGWRSVMKLNVFDWTHNEYDKPTFKIKNYQECLDELLGSIESISMKGDYWSKDQEELANKLFESKGYMLQARARPGTQFASNRVDRDDINWRSYVNDELVDAHLWRNGYTEENHANIMELMRMKFPNEDFTWLENYRNEYLKLL